MSGALHRALAGLARLRRQQNFTGSRSTDEAKQFFRQRADGFAAWLVELPPGDRGRVKKEAWYSFYRDWCRDTGHQPLSSTKFYDRARRWDGSLGITITITRSKGFEYFNVQSDGVVEASRSREY